MTFDLVTGSRYVATLRLGFFEGVASNDMVAAKLRDAGFTDVSVTGSGRDRMAGGEWGGPSQTVELPEQITHVKVIA